MKSTCGWRALAVQIAFALVWNAGCGGANEEVDASEGERSAEGRVHATGPAPSPSPPGPGGNSLAQATELPRVMPLTCWLPPDSECDVREPGLHCDEAETCDLLLSEDDRLVIRCLPDEAGLPEGEACDNRTGAFCEAGVHCMEGVCRHFCCVDEECGADARCAAVLPSFGRLGVCMEGTADDTPSCGHYGAFCRSAEDCCSGFCHLDHCH